VIVDNTAPSTPSLTFSGTSANVFLKTSTNALYFRPAAGGAFTVTATSTDAQSGIREYKFSSLATNGFTEALTGGKMSYTFGATATQPSTAPTIAAISNAGASSALATYSLIADTTGPTGGALTVNNVAGSATGTTSYSGSGSFSISKRTDFNTDAGSGFVSSTLTRQSATLSNGTCGTFGSATTLTGNPNQTNLAAGCYRYTLTGLDRVGNAALLVTTVEVDKTDPTVTLSAPARTTGAVPLTFGAADTGSGVDTTSFQMQRASSTYTASNDSCGSFFFFSNLGNEGIASPFTDTSVSSGKCYEYELEVSDKAGNSANSSAATVRVNSSKPTLSGITDTTAGSSSGKPQVNDVVTLTFSAPIEAASIPASVTLSYSRPTSGSTTVAIGGISGSAAWSTGDSSVSAKYLSVTGATASATAKTTVSGSTVKLTITAINDPSNRFSSGGPATVSGTLAGTIKDLFGNTASTNTFSFGNVRLF
jgi:hypothetical protein